MTDTPAEPAPVAPSSAGRAPVEPSVFTKIINGQIPGRFVWADDVCVAFATIEPHTAGHVLVVPRHQFESFTDADEATVSHLAVVARRIAATQMRVFDAARPGLVVVGFDVPHLHIHVLPLYKISDIDPAHARAVLCVGASAVPGRALPVSGMWCGAGRGGAAHSAETRRRRIRGITRKHLGVQRR